MVKCERCGASLTLSRQKIKVKIANTTVDIQPDVLICSNGHRYASLYLTMKGNDTIIISDDLDGGEGRKMWLN